MLENPEGMLKALCLALQVCFDPAMLTWEAGPRASDGIWASHWYQSVNASTGFARPGPPVECPEELSAIVAECEPYYEQMREHRLVAE